MDNKSHAQRFREIFNEACELSGAERDEYLQQSCGEDPKLRDRVVHLLAAAEKPDDFLSTPTANQVDSASAATVADAGGSAERAGTTIGRYKLLQRIGEGGFGSVYLAEQEHPVRRRVAMKIIKLGMDTKQVIARFEAERQALAMMDHPNIARVLDAGATDTGRPYFVMELVKGDPIVEYCDKGNLSITDRLGLFVQICHAVQHAHQKGIIHRDLKSSNVLVSTQDGRPCAKVIDFGIAKATSVRLTEKTLFTEHRQLIGTPEYMSPEQAEGSLDIDTRTDVYSLGVLLYELLTGVTPFDAKELRSAAFGEIQRIIREVEPPKPSTRLSTNIDTLASVAAHRHSDPKKLGPLVRGELDWIVMKSLEKDRSRRYETANDLALDVQRHLAGEAVIAAPPGTVYRMRKFVRRNKGGVLSGTAVAAALLVGLVGFAWQARVAQHERDLAQDERTRAVSAEAQTKERADQLQQVSDFQAEMLAQVDPTEAGKLLSKDVRSRFDAALAKAGVSDGERIRQVTAFAEQWKRVNATDAARELIDRTILKPAVAAIDKQFADQPVIDAELRQVLAARYRDFGMFDAALPLQERAVAIRRRVLGEEHAHTFASISHLGALLENQGNLSAAETYYREALEKSRRVLGEEHPDTLIAINNLGSLLTAQGKLSEAEPYCREALEKNRRICGEEHPDTISSISNLASLLQAQGKLSEAESYCREAVEKNRRVHGEEHPQTVRSINNLGNVLQAQGKLSEAEPYYREALEKHRRVLGEEHQQTLISISNMATLLEEQGKLSAAEPYHHEGLEKHRRVLGEDHPNTLAAINNMAGLLMAQGKLSAAEPYLREAFEKSRRLQGEEHPNTLASIGNMGVLLQTQGKLRAAEPFFREALEKTRRMLGDQHPITLAAICNMGFLLNDEGNLSEAEPYYREALEKRRSALGAEHPDTLASMNNMGSLLQNQGKLSDAEKCFRDALDVRRRVLGEQHPDTLLSLANLGALLKTQGKLGEAMPLFEQAAIGIEIRKFQHQKTRYILSSTINCYEELKEFEKAEIWRRKWLATVKEETGRESPAYAGELAGLGLNLLRQKKYSDAEPILRECLAIDEKQEPDTWTTFHVKAMLGGSLVGQKKYVDAEPLLKVAHDGIAERADTIPTEVRTQRVSEAVERLVELYTAWHAAEPGKGSDAKAEEWRRTLTLGSTRPATTQP